MSVTVAPVVLRSVVRPLGRLIFLPQSPWTVQRRALDLAFTWPGAPRELTVTRDDLGGVPTEVLAPEQPGNRVLLYVHGGGYTVGSPRSHRALAGRLAFALRAVTYVPDYRLAPEHRFPAAFEDSLGAYLAVLERAQNDEKVFVAGDSAGGGLALALGVAAVQRGLPLPAAIGLLCPAIDWTLEAMHRVPRDGREPMLTPDLLRRFCDATRIWMPTIGRTPRCPRFLQILPGCRHLSSTPPVTTRCWSSRNSWSIRREMPGSPCNTASARRCRMAFTPVRACWVRRTGRSTRLPRRWWRCRARPGRRGEAASSPQHFVSAAIVFLR